ncbi:MAG TPA: hypothetical protein VJT75_16270, partial [Thermoleophilaceae bacterium]|nr:hypothetical protein [Thermoleophilaceae bacterium]
MRGGRIRTPGDLGPSLLGLALVGVATALTLLAASDLSTGRVVLHGIAAGLPIAVGLALLHAQRARRVALALLAAGLLCALAALAQSSDSALYSVGRVAVWMLEPVLVYLILAFPLGRFASSMERRLFLATALLAGVLYLPTALLAEFPAPNPWASSCGMSCPDNAFNVVNLGVVDDVIRPLRELLTAAIYLAVAALVARRAWRGGALTRRVLAPMAAVAGFRAATMCVYFVARADGGTSAFADALGTLWLLSAPAIAAGCAVALTAQRVFA